MRVVRVPADAPRDIHRRTMRIIPLADFPGTPVAGELIELYQPGARTPVPGVVAPVRTAGVRDGGIVGVEPDFQLIHA